MIMIISGEGPFHIEDRLEGHSHLDAPYRCECVYICPWATPRDPWIYKYIYVTHAPYRCECIINTQAVWPMYMPWAQSSVIWRVDMYSKRVPERNPKISLKNTKNFPAVKKATDGCLSKKLAVVMNLCYYYHTINGWGKKSKFLIVIN